MSASDAKPIPQKGEQFRVYFPLFDTYGQLVIGATGLDSEISKDGGGFVDCVNETVEVGRGIYYLELTATEMNADAVALVIQSTTLDVVYTPILLYPEESDDIINIPAIADAVWDETLAAHVAVGSTGAKLDELEPCAGAGANQFVYTVTKAGTGSPLDGVRVWVTSDAAGLFMVALGYTNALGQVTFWLDSGTWYVWRYRSGYSFSNPDVEVIP